MKHMSFQEVNNRRQRSSVSKFQKMAPRVTVGFLILIQLCQGLSHILTMQQSCRHQYMSSVLPRYRAINTPQLSVFGTVRFPLSRTFATMYLPDDWVDDDDTMNTDSTTMTSNPMIPQILQTPEWVAPLARLAAEYTKHMNNGIRVNVQQIEHVSVRNVASSHMDIEAIVCENDSCVSLSVPVPFTQPCVNNNNDHHVSSMSQHQPRLQQDSNFEDCVIRNIKELDTIQLQQQALSPTTTDTTDIMITSIENIEYPSWWVYPGPSMEFTKECQVLLNILNEQEFTSDVLRLVTKGLYRMLNMDPHNTDGAKSMLQVHTATAVAVGPAGIIFRVNALYEGQNEIVDVPIAFSSNGLLSVNEHDIKALREAVLNCVELTS
jgi:hypothetical protein